jgi:hypothetical protein
MRSFYRGFVVLSAAGAIFCACNQSNNHTAGSGGSGGVDCHDVALLGDSCDTCLHQQCCAELDACFRSHSCLYCSTRHGAPIPCQRDPERPVLAAFTNCAAEKCNPACERLYKDFDGGTPVSCQDVEVDSGVDFGDCVAPDVSVMRGTMLGKPFDQTFAPSHVSINQISEITSLTVDLPDLGSGSGKLYLQWPHGSYLYDGLPYSLESGTLQLPGEIIDHLIDSGTLWRKCGADIYRFSFGTKEGDYLTGCAW